MVCLIASNPCLPRLVRPHPQRNTFTAFRWHPDTGLQGILHPHRISLKELLCMDRQKTELMRNTRPFVNGKPANNAQLWVSRGTGKSSLVKAVLGSFTDIGLRAIEVDKSALLHMQDLLDPLYGRPERFVLFWDDLSFEADEPAYKALKCCTRRHGGPPRIMS